MAHSWHYEATNSVLPSSHDPSKEAFCVIVMACGSDEFAAACPKFAPNAVTHIDTSDAAITAQKAFEAAGMTHQRTDPKQYAISITRIEGGYEMATYDGFRHTVAKATTETSRFFDSDRLVMLGNLTEAINMELFLRKSHIPWRFL